MTSQSSPTNMAEGFLDLREKLSLPRRFRKHREYPPVDLTYSNDDADRVAPWSRYDSQTQEQREEVLQNIHSGIRQRRLFDDETCKTIEGKIDAVVRDAEVGVYRKHTVDRAPLRKQVFLRRRLHVRSAGRRAGKKGAGERASLRRGRSRRDPGLDSRVGGETLGAGQADTRGIHEQCRHQRLPARGLHRVPHRPAPHIRPSARHSFLLQ